MKLFAKFRTIVAIAFTAIGSKISPIEGRYEAGQYFSTRRSWLPAWVRDARFDANSATRLEILRKARYFERNNAIVNRLADLFEQYTVGPNGLRFVPASSDPEWNKRAAAWWSDWCKLCDLTTLQNFGTIQSLCARSWAIDGEIFLLKTRGKIRDNGQSYPRIQLIESHRVETPGELSADGRIIDGIKVDDRGRPVSYFIRETNFGTQEETYREVPADEMIHIFEPTRPGMYRGIPLLYAVLNDLHDLDDLQMYSMDGAKEAAATINVIQTKSGEMDAMQYRRARMQIPGTDGTSGGSSQDRTSYYDTVFRGTSKVLKEGDEMKQFQVTRPSESERALWDHLTSKVCAGFGISKLLVFPWSMQGTVTRADLEVASVFFRSRSAILASKFEELWSYVIGWATKNVRELSDPPLDWMRISIRPPRSVNVDVGRNAIALISEYEAGWRTLEEICGELGLDWRDVLRQRAVELAEAIQLEKEYKLPPGSLIAAMLNSLKQQNAGQSGSGNGNGTTDQTVGTEG
jgi:lambda family phage portal protein